MKKNRIRIPESKKPNPKSKQAKASGSADAESAEEASEDDDIFVGMAVEARASGKGEWRKATVMKEHLGKGGTTYDLKYADGKLVSGAVCSAGCDVICVFPGHYCRVFGTLSVTWTQKTVIQNSFFILLALRLS